MENELNRLVNALPGLEWTALSDGPTDFSIDAGVNTPAAALCGGEIVNETPGDMSEYLSVSWPCA
jgi:hypothetical protein